MVPASCRRSGPLGACVRDEVVERIDACGEHFVVMTDGFLPRLLERVAVHGPPPQVRALVTARDAHGLVGRLR